MTRRVVTSETLADRSAAPELIRQRHFSPAVISGPLVFVSGIAAKDLTRDIAGQTTEIFEYLEAVLAEAGSELARVVKLQAFVASPADYPGYSATRRRFFPSDPPASTTVVSQFILPGMLVEVDAIAERVE
jgi:enamine deaminase RidA (YjgF/YER057c/UK114 family)